MRVEWAITCRYAESDGSSATIVGAGIDLLLPAQLPAAIGLFVAVRFVGSADEWAEEHELGFKILGPNAEVVKEEEKTKMTVRVEQQLFTTYEQGAILVTAHRFEVKASGAYSLEISIDGENKKSVPFYVHEGPPPPAADDSATEIG